MPPPIAKSKYQLVTYVSTREAARLSGVAERAFLKAARDQIVGGIYLSSGELFIRWEYCPGTFPSSAMAGNMNVTPLAEAGARSSNYENSVRSNDAPHVGSRHGDAS